MTVVNRVKSVNRGKLGLNFSLVKTPPPPPLSVCGG